MRLIIAVLTIGCFVTAGFFLLVSTSPTNGAESLAKAVFFIVLAVFFQGLDMQYDIKEMLNSKDDVSKRRK